MGFHPLVPVSHTLESFWKLKLEVLVRFIDGIGFDLTPEIVHPCVDIFVIVILEEQTFHLALDVLGSAVVLFYRRRSNESRVGGGRA